MKAFIGRTWPLAIFFVIMIGLVWRAEYVRHKAQLASCPGSNQTLVVNYLAVPYFQSAIRCQNS